MGYDKKYGKVVTDHGDIPDDELVVVFRARDRLLPDVLEHYHQLCDAAGSPARHLRLIHDLFQDVKVWQREHLNRVGLPDSERSREWTSRGATSSSGEYHDDDTLRIVHDVLVRSDLTSDQATDAILRLQNAGILFREISGDRSNRFPEDLFIQPYLTETERSDGRQEAGRQENPGQDA